MLLQQSVYITFKDN